MTLGSKGPEDVATGGITIGLFGETGSGKTTVAATAIDYFKRVIGPHVKTYIIEAEGGLRPIRSRPDFRYDDVYDWKGFVAKTDEIIKTPDLRETFPVVQADNMSEFAEFSMTETLKEARKDEPEWPEWRKNSRVVVQRIRKLRDAARQQRIAVIINLWDRPQTDNEGTVKSVRPDLNPHLARLFVGAVDIAAYLEVADDEGRRVLHLAQSSRLKAKFRQDMLDPIVSQIPHDLYGPPSREGVLSLAPLMATLIGGEPFPSEQFAPPEGLRPSRFAAPEAREAARTNSRPERPERAARAGR